MIPEWSMIPACLSRVLFCLNKGNVEGTNSENLCLTFVYVCFVLFAM